MARVLKPYWKELYTAIPKNIRAPIKEELDFTTDNPIIENTKSNNRMESPCTEKINNNEPAYTSIEP